MFRILNYAHNCDRVTYFKCAKCGQESHFFGVDVPLSCDKCGILIPNALDLALCKSERVAYHLDKKKEVFH